MQCFGRNDKYPYTSYTCVNKSVINQFKYDTCSMYSGTREAEQKVTQEAWEAATFTALKSVAYVVSPACAPDSRRSPPGTLGRPTRGSRTSKAQRAAEHSELQSCQHAMLSQCSAMLLWVAMSCYACPFFCAQLESQSLLSKSARELRGLGIRASVAVWCPRPAREHVEASQLG